MKTNADYEVSVAMLKNIIENYIINEVRTRNPGVIGQKNNAEIYKSLKDQ